MAGAGNGATVRPIRARRGKPWIQTRPILVSYRASSRPDQAYQSRIGNSSLRRRPTATPGPVGSRPFRGRVLGLFMERLPDRFIPNETLVIRCFLTGFQETRFALGNLGAGFGLFTHISPFSTVKTGGSKTRMSASPVRLTNRTSRQFDRATRLISDCDITPHRVFL